MTLAAKIISFSGSSAANAIRHGLSGTHYVPAHAREHVDEIRSELKKAFSPSNPHDEQILEELAIRRWQVFEACRLLDLIEEDEFKRGPELYEKHLHREFVKHFDLLQSDPEKALPLLHGSLKGVNYLIKVWGEALDTIDEKHPVYPAMIKKCVQAMGSHWSLDQISNESLAMVALFIQLMDDPDRFICSWVEADGEDGQSFRKKRLDHYLSIEMNREKAAHQLSTLIDKIYRDLFAIKRFFETTMDDRIKAFSASYAGYGMQDPESAKHTSALRRYLKSASNRSWKLESLLQKRASVKKSEPRLHLYDYRPTPNPDLPINPIDDMFPNYGPSTMDLMDDAFLDQVYDFEDDDSPENEPENNLPTEPETTSQVIENNDVIPELQNETLAVTSSQKKHLDQMFKSVQKSNQNWSNDLKIAMTQKK